MDERGARTGKEIQARHSWSLCFPEAESRTISPTDSPVPNRNDRQKIELTVEIFEGHLGCTKSTHSMDAATWGR